MLSRSMNTVSCEFCDGDGEGGDIIFINSAVFVANIDFIIINYYYYYYKMDCNGTKCFVTVRFNITGFFSHESEFFEYLVKIG